MSWFKPFKMEFAPFAEFGSASIDEVIARFMLPGTQTSIAELISQRQQQNDILGLTLKLPVGYKASEHEQQLQQLHDGLVGELTKLGINELNLQLIEQKVSGAGASQSGRVQTAAAQSGSSQQQMYTDAMQGQNSQAQSSNGQAQHQGRLSGQSQGSQSQRQTSLPPVIAAQTASSKTASTNTDAITDAINTEQAQSNASANTNQASSKSEASGKSESVQREEQLTSKRPAPPTQSQLKAHPRIKNVIVVASGKGGVGKSTTTVNLALALQQTGARVGVLDADIYGPSIPTMLGTAGKTPLIENEQFIPLEAFGMAVLSIGNLTGDDNTPVVWRGPKATGALMQLFNQTAWPDLDYLLIDMPPGTGDIQLTLAQRIPVTGAVIVTTPQHVALMDAQKGIELFNKVNIPVLGVVENMSTHTCSHCGHNDEIFGTGAGDKLSQTYQIPLLGRLPLQASIRQNSDQGTPSVVAQDSAASYYKDIALSMLVQLAKIPARPRDPERIF